MAIDYIKNVKISAVCCAVPTDKLTAEDFYQYLDKDNVDRFVKDAGVKQKFYSKNAIKEMKHASLVAFIYSSIPGILTNSCSFFWSTALSGSFN